MKLLQMVTRGLRVPDRTYSFRSRKSGAPLDVVLVTGPPSSGKTSLLLTIAALKEAFGPYGAPPDLRRVLRRGAARGYMEAIWLLSDGEMSRARLGQREQRTAVEIGPEGERRSSELGLRRALTPLSRDPSAGKFELFPANRSLLVDSWRFSHGPLSAAIEDVRRLGSDIEKYAAVRRALHDAAMEHAAKLSQAFEARGVALRSQQPDPFAPYKEAIAAALPELRLTGIKPHDGSVALTFTRRDGRTVALEELSASEEQAALFAFAHAWLGLCRSVLLIDSPELHIHSAEHAGFFSRITRLGADNQIIAATGSSGLLTEAAPDQVIDLRDEAHLPPLAEGTL